MGRHRIDPIEAHSDDDAGDGGNDGDDDGILAERAAARGDDEDEEDDGEGDGRHIVGFGRVYFMKRSGGRDDNIIIIGWHESISIGSISS